MVQFAEAARRRREELLGVPVQPDIAQMGPFERAARERRGGPEAAIPAIETAPGFEPERFGPELATPAQPAPSPEERRAATLQQQGAGPLSRVGGALAQPFQETQFGIPEEATKQFTDTGFPTLDILNDLVINGVASPAFSLIQGLGAASEGLIDALGQTAIEAGADINTTRQIVRDSKGLAEAAAIVTGTSAPGAAVRIPATEVAVARQARNLPRGARLTKGDITQDVDVQAFEEAVAQGLKGERPKNVLLAAREEQTRAFQGSVEEIQTGITGRLPATQRERGLGTQRAGTALKQQAKLDRDAIKTAYDEARELDASVETGLIKDFKGATETRLLDEGFDVEVMEKLQRRFTDFDDLSESLNTADVKKIELIRKRMVKDIEATKVSDPPQASALRRTRDDLDAHLNNLLDEGLVRGNDEAITAWSKARNLRTEFGKRFETDKVIKRVVNEDLTQEQTINLVFGGSKMGFKADAGKIVGQMRTILGAESDAFRALKEEAVLRLVRDQPDTFSGVKFDNAFQKSMIDNPTLMRSLFTAEEINEMNSLAKIARRVTEKVPGAVNRSATFINEARFARKATSKFPIVGDFLEALFRIREEGKALGQIQENISVPQTVQGFRRDPALAARAFAATVAVQNEEE